VLAQNQKLQKLNPNDFLMRKWLCEISVYENGGQSYFYGKENNKEKLIFEQFILAKRRFQN
jgi:hypothetical protein